jgi:FixJ family two-component response regulator
MPWGRCAVLLLMMHEAGLPTKTLISIIDDDEAVREAIAGLIKSLGFAVEAFSSALDFLACPNARDTSCLIADVHMPRMTGVELHRRLMELGYAIPTILITAYPDDSVRARALADGVICYLSKPCEQDALLGCVCLALERAKRGEYHS